MPYTFTQYLNRKSQSLLFLKYNKWMVYKILHKENAKNINKISVLIIENLGAWNSPRRMKIRGGLTHVRNRAPFLGGNFEYKNHFKHPFLIIITSLSK